MNVQQPILAATDFSPQAELAVARAAALARACQRPLHLLHACNDFTWSNLRALLRQPPGYDLEGALGARLRAIADDLAGQGLPAVGSAVVVGRASAGIVARARELDAGLVVLGAHGEGLGRELALGGTAIKTLRASPCPVLVVRADPARPYARILVGTDFSEASTRALRTALDLFPAARFGVVHAHGTPHAGNLRRLAGAAAEDVEHFLDQAREASARNLAAFIVDADYRAAGGVEGISREGHAAGVLLEEAGRTGADLVVVGKHGRSALDERLMGSVTLNVLHHAPCDVLLVP